MKKLPGMLGLLALVTLLVLLPAREAKATAMSEETCSECGANLYLERVNVSTHFYTCYNPNCVNFSIELRLELHTLDGNCYCSVCNETVHDLVYLEDGVHIEATCTEPGIDYDSRCWHCKRCGRYVDSDNDPVGTIKPALEHDWETGWTVDAKQGVHYHACSRCEERKDSAPHTGGTATCTSGPLCDACGAEYDEPDPDNHDWGAWTQDPNDSLKHLHTCQRNGCGATESAAHTGGTATCTEPANCDTCNLPYGQLAEHVFSMKWTTKDGKHWHKCSNPDCKATSDPVACSGGKATCTEPAVCDTCGQAYGGVDPDAHPTDRIAEDPAVPAGCTREGLKAGTHCEACGGTVVKQEVDPAKGHTEAIDPAVEPTCTETGLTDGKHCSVCGEILAEQKEIPAKGHTEVIDKAVDATCTETGLTEGRHCSVCGEELEKQEEIPAKGHTEVIDEAVEPTCTRTGLTEGRHCSVCGEILAEQKETGALGHRLGAWLPDDPGSHTANCARCRHTAVKPCTMMVLPQEEGAEEISFCPVCGYCVGPAAMTAAEGLEVLSGRTNGNALAFILEAGEGRYLILSFERNGEPAQPEGEIIYALLEEFAEIKFAHVLADASTAAAETAVGEYGVTLGLDYTPEDSEPVSVMILKME